jgi:hypothetical protein
MAPSSRTESIACLGGYQGQSVVSIEANGRVRISNHRFKGGQLYDKLRLQFWLKQSKVMERP